MTPQPRPKSDDTRARIIEAADSLFRRLGFAKTAVADIAAELGMSPANVYRFFSSKNAIVEAICQRYLGEIEAGAWAVVHANASAAARIERLFLEILAYHSKNFLSEKRVHDIVLVAIEHSWTAISAHKDVIRTIIERMLRDGVKTGEFEAVDPPETADLILRSMVCFTHPVLIGQCMEEGEDLGAAARASVRFLLRAITPRG
ncbi:MAG TPA: TetR/AcrR family transcriptional regulator [Xanthobacteraceae bacterium]|nr:TetR/AcrR family transcriptional regulator [Xanthobacteraceae bacterium]